MDQDQKRIIESALFSAGRPLSAEELEEATGIEKKSIPSIVSGLMKQYETMEISIEVAKVGDKYAMQLKAEYANFVVKLAPKEIPERLLRTLALIAYHQPMTQKTLFDMIGARTYEHVPDIERLGLIRTKPEGRTKLIKITPAFAEYFGIDTTDEKEIKQKLIEKTGIVVETEEEKKDVEKSPEKNENKAQNEEKTEQNNGDKKE